MSVRGFLKAIWDLLRTPTGRSYAIVASISIAGITVVNVYAPRLSMIQAALSPIAVFCLFGIFFETAAFTTQVSKILNSVHAYTQETLNRLRPGELRVLLARVYEALSGNSNDDYVSELCNLGAGFEIGRQYQLGTTVVIHHEPFKGREDVIQSRTRIEFTIHNWSEEDVEVPLPFETTIPWETVPDDDAPVFELENFLVHLEGDEAPILSLGSQDILHKKDDVSGDELYQPVSGFSVPPGRRAFIRYHSIRRIPYHDIYLYNVGKRPVRGLMLRYEFAKLTELCPVHPKLTVASQHGELRSVGESQDRALLGDGSVQWEVDGWLLAGNAVVLSW